MKFKNEIIIIPSDNQPFDANNLPTQEAVYRCIKNTFASFSEKCQSFTTGKVYSAKIADITVMKVEVESRFKRQPTFGGQPLVSGSPMVTEINYNGKGNGLIAG